MAKTPHAVTVTLVVANAEYTYAFPDRVRGYQFQARQSVALRFAWQQGQIGPGPLGNYFTLKADNVYSHDEGEGAAMIQPSILYVASGTAGTVVEIEVW